MTIHRVPTAGAVGEGYPRGHLGHLTPEEEQALKDFKVFVEEKDLFKPGPPPSHDDATLLCVLLELFCLDLPRRTVPGFTDD